MLRVIKHRVEALAALLQRQGKSFNVVIIHSVGMANLAHRNDLHGKLCSMAISTGVMAGQAGWIRRIVSSPVARLATEVAMICVQEFRVVLPFRARYLSLLLG